MKALADALLTNDCLKELYLGDNRITDEGAIAIAAALRMNNTLTILSLKNNKVGDKGAISITDALSTNGSLKHLNLENNIRISEQTRNVIVSTIRAGVEFLYQYDAEKSSDLKLSANVSLNLPSFLQYNLFQLMLS